MLPTAACSISSLVLEVFYGGMQRRHPRSVARLAHNRGVSEAVD